MFYKNYIQPRKNYLGSKNVLGTIHQLVNHFPPHDVFITGFVGNGNEIVLKKPASITIAVDRDKQLIKDWQKLNPGKEIDFMHGNFMKVLPELHQRYKDNRLLIYCDPPYMHSTRSSKEKYLFEMSDSEHASLLFKLIACECNVVLSCYDNALYCELLSDWNKTTFLSATRGGAKQETIYYNFDLVALNDYSLLGNGFMDRQRIKRATTNMINKLNCLPVLHRNKILTELCAHFKLVPDI